MGYKVLTSSRVKKASSHTRGLISPRVLGYGIDIEELNRVALPATTTLNITEVLVIDEIGKFSVESRLLSRPYGVPLRLTCPPC